ncbi:class I SAM-dependent methyltransferase [Vibrio profundum]|uniref:class I SAM-dependent methyltransferase n=1 Tax=Vibrio profundum TaxID=2910247 RepID=UPI003D0E2F6E
MLALDPIVRFYDSDHPDPENPIYKENLSCFTEYPLLGYDFQRFIEYAQKHNVQRVLEVCCGTGRIAIPLAKSGLHITGIDKSSEMLILLKNKCLENSLKDQIDIAEANSQEFDLGLTRFDMSIIAFNSFLCIADEQAQIETLANIYHHLRPKGVLLIDFLNPCYLSLSGTNEYRAGPNRRCIYTGKEYVRFSRSTPIDHNQRQVIFGYYQEIASEKKYEFEFTWRPVTADQIISMLEESGFSKVNLYGDSYRTQKFNEESQHIFVEAFV